MADSFDIPALQREALLNHESATEKAAALLLESEVNKMDKGEWRQLIAGVPQDVKRAIVAIMSAGTLSSLQLHACITVRTSASKS